MRAALRLAQAASRELAPYLRQADGPLAYPADGAEDWEAAMESIGYLGRACVRLLANLREGGVAYPYPVTKQGRCDASIVGYGLLDALAVRRLLFRWCAKPEIRVMCGEADAVQAFARLRQYALFGQKPLTRAEKDLMARVTVAASTGFTAVRYSAHAERFEAFEEPMGETARRIAEDARVYRARQLGKVPEKECRADRLRREAVEKAMMERARAVEEAARTGRLGQLEVNERDRSARRVEFDAVAWGFYAGCALWTSGFLGSLASVHDRAGLQPPDVVRTAGVRAAEAWLTEMDRVERDTDVNDIGNAVAYLMLGALHRERFARIQPRRENRQDPFYMLTACLGSMEVAGLRAGLNREIAAHDKGLAAGAPHPDGEGPVTYRPEWALHCASRGFGAGGLYGGALVCPLDYAGMHERLLQWVDDGRGVVRAPLMIWARRRYHVSVSARPGRSTRLFACDGLAEALATWAHFTLGKSQGETVYTRVAKRILGRQR